MTSAASGSRKSIFATAGSIPTADFGQLSCGHNGEVPVLDHLRGAQKWLLLLLGAVALGLLPWTAYLTATLPRQHVAHHWDLAWAGFDVFEAVALAATMFALLRRLPQLPLLAAVAGTALLCDAWFQPADCVARRRPALVARRGVRGGAAAGSALLLDRPRLGSGAR
jgi:hypothetical protein